MTNAIFLHFAKYGVLLVDTEDSKAGILKELMHILKLQILRLVIIPTFQMNLLVFS